MSSARTRRRLRIGLAAALMTVAPLGLGLVPTPFGVSTARAADISINIFFDKLAPQGVWVSHPQYNYVFCPRVAADWRPYTRGHWVYLRHYGWYFASDEPFAWAVYHYGRWFADQRLGWCWVPGTVFAGAWVSWRRGADYVGWSPLPPVHKGYAVAADVPSAEPPRSDWVFVPAPRFLEPDLSVSIVIGERQPEIFQRTQYAGPVTVENNIVVNTVIDLASVEKATGKKVTELTPKAVNDPAQQTKPQGDQVALFAPAIAAPGTEKPKQVVGVEEANKALGRPPAGNPPAGNASSSAPPPSSLEPSSTPASEASSSAPASEKGASSSAPPPSAAPAFERSAVEPRRLLLERSAAAQGRILATARHLPRGRGSDQGQVRADPGHESKARRRFQLRTRRQRPLERAANERARPQTRPHLPRGRGSDKGQVRADPGHQSKARRRPQLRTRRQQSLERSP